jgi:hypothetical protein
MGNPRIYFYPDEAGSLEMIDFGEGLSDLQITQRREVFDGYTRAGSFTRSVGRSYLEVRIILENFTNTALVRQFESLSSHLERGNPIGFALDHSKAWAAFVRRSTMYGYYSPDRGTTEAFTSGNMFRSWSSSASIANGDEVVIASAAPSGLREIRQTSAATAAGAETVHFTSDPLIYTHTDTPIVVRSRDFYPALIMPEESLGDPIITTNHRISYTLDLLLVEDWGTLAAVNEIVDGLRGTDNLPSDGLSLQEAITEYRSGLNSAYIATDRT